jgi:hypothetical protein
MEPNGNRTIVSTEAKRLAGRCGRNDFQPLKSSIEKVESRSQDWKKVTGHFLKVKSRDLKLRLGRLADWPCGPCYHTQRLGPSLEIMSRDCKRRHTGVSCMGVDPCFAAFSGAARRVALACIYLQRVDSCCWHANERQICDDAGLRCFRRDLELCKDKASTQ